MITNIVLILAVLIVISFAMRYFKASKTVQGKLVVITGGSQGIGFELATNMVKRGAHVIVIARN